MSSVAIPPDHAAEKLGQLQPNPFRRSESVVLGRILLKTRSTVHEVFTKIPETDESGAGIILEISSIQDSEERSARWLDFYNKARSEDKFATARYCLGEIRDHSPEKYTAALGMDHGQLHLVEINLDSNTDAYFVFKALCKRYPELSMLQVREALRYLFKSYRLSPENVLMDVEFQESLGLFNDIKKHFGEDHFRDIEEVNIIGQTLRRGDKPAAPNEAKWETGFQEMQRIDRETYPHDEEIPLLDTTKYSPHEEPEKMWIEKEKHNLIGKALIILANREHQAFLKYPEKNADSRVNQRALAEDAVRHIEMALELLSRLLGDREVPLLDAEAGEPLRLQYNLAKACFHLAIACPGDFDKFCAAEDAIEKVQKAGETVANRNIQARALLLLGDLFRYAGGSVEAPGKHQLTRAITCNENALSKNPDDISVILSALINLVQMRRHMNDTVKAREDCAALEILNFERGGDENIARQFEVLVKQECEALRVPFRRPGAVGGS